MGIGNYQIQLCKSSKDIEVFWAIAQTTNKYNAFDLNISRFCKDNDFSKSKVFKILSDSVKIGFMKKVDRGVYILNPFAITSVGSNNATIEHLQAHWSENIEKAYKELTKR